MISIKDAQSGSMFGLCSWFTPLRGRPGIQIELELEHLRMGGGGALAELWEASLPRWGSGEGQGAWGPVICGPCDLGQFIQPPRVTCSSPAKWLTIAVPTSRTASLLGDSVCLPGQPSQHQGLTVTTVLRLDKVQ